MTSTSQNSQNRRGSNNNNNQDNQHGNYSTNAMGNPIGNLSDSLAGLSVGNYGGTSSAPGSQDRNPHGSLSVLNESIGLNWDSSGGNISQINQPHPQQPPPQQQNYPQLVPDGSGSIVEQRKRGESIDIFLSRSPSQSLGSEFLKFRNEELDAIPSLSLDMNKNVHPQGQGQGQGKYPAGVSGNDPNVHNRVIQGQSMSSPSCSVTGTSASSRSTSPSWNANANDGRRGAAAQTILAYNQQPGVPVPSNVNEFGAHSRGLISAHQDSSFIPGTAGNIGGMQATAANYMPMDSYDHRDVRGMQQHIPQQLNQQVQAPQGYVLQGNDMGGQQQHAMGNDPKAGQVFYMAVPTQDGQGQVLQPIQMVQLPGQPNAFVLPSASPTGSMQYQAAPQQGMAMGGGMHQSHYNPGYASRETRQMKQHQQQQPYFAGSGAGVGAGRGAGRVKNYSPMPNAGRPLGRETGYGEQPQAYQYPEENFTLSGGDAQYGDHLTQQRDPNRKDMLTNNEIVANLYASPKRPPLRELLGHVRRLSRDQVGCRLLQQALDEEGDTAATAILNEGLSFWGEAMVDPFGNYLFQKILEKITSAERILLIKTVSPRLVNASLNLHGTRSVQKVVELCAIDEANEGDGDYGTDVIPQDLKSKKGTKKRKETAAEILTKSLTPAAARLCIDSHGNHVIQRILLKLPYQYSQFVFEAVANSVGDVARHRHGCCVIQRCLDSQPSEARSNLVNKIVEKSLELMQDAYGNYVVQYVLDVCSDEDVHAVCESVAGNVSLLAIQKFSSNVMEKCLERCTDKVRENYLEELSGQERIRELMMDPFGNYVIQRALAVASHTQALKLVDSMRPHLMSASGGGIRNTAGGRRILAKIERRFPHFNINEEGSIERAIHRKGATSHEITAPMGPPQRGGPRRGQKKMGPPKDILPHYHHQQRYREYPQDPGAHNMDPNYYMMGEHRGYEHM